MKPLHTAEYYEKRYGGQLLATRLQIELNESRAVMARQANEQARAKGLDRQDTIREMLGAMSLGTVAWGQEVLANENLIPRDRRIVENMVETARATC